MQDSKSTQDNVDAQGLSQDETGGFISDKDKKNKESGFTALNKFEAKAKTSNLKNGAKETKPFNITWHAMILAGLGLLLLIPQLFFNLLLDERQEYLYKAKYAIMSPWGDELDIGAPVISIPIYKSVGEKTEESELYIFADKMDTSIDIDVTERKKGFYAASVYTASVSYKGSFSMTDLFDVLDNYQISGRPYLKILQDENSVIDKINKISFAGKEFEAESGKGAFGLDSIQIPLDTSHLDEEQISGRYDIDVSLIYRGGEHLSYRSLARNNSILIKGKGIVPGFEGDALPSKSNIEEHNFDALYNISNITTGMARYLIDDNISSKVAKTISLNLKQGFDQYTLVERLTKYVLLFIAITFGTVFVFEMVTRRFLSSLQFIIIGLALIMFYMVLLSLSEYVIFSLSYLIAALIMVCMISLYIKALFKDKRLTVIMFIMMSGTYGILFAIIHSHNYALIIGTATMLVLLGVIMYITSKLGLTEVKES